MRGSPHIMAYPSPVSSGNYVFLIIYNLLLADMGSEPLEFTSGVIWTALCIDYPGHSFSHLGFFYG